MIFLNWHKITTSINLAKTISGRICIWPKLTVLSVQSSSATTYAFTYRVNIWTFHWHVSVLNNGFEIGQLVPDFENFLKLMVIFDNNDVTLGTVGNVLTSIGQICCIYSSCKPTTNNEILLHHTCNRKKQEKAKYQVTDTKLKQ